MSFDQALAFVLAHEGGRSLDPRDPGGATSFGISWRFLQDLPLAVADVDADGIRTWRDVLALTRDAAAGIYRAYFWDGLRLGDMPDRLACCLFDTAVNCGRARAVRWLQQALNAILITPPLAEDGIMGPKTLTLAASCHYHVPELLGELSIARLGHYLDCIRADPALAAYAGGWRQRVTDLRRFLSTGTAPEKPHA